MSIKNIVCDFGNVIGIYAPERILERFSLTREEKELFKLLFMRDRSGEDLSPTSDFTESVDMIMKANAVTKEEAELIHLEMWSCVHGIAVMLATSFLLLDTETVSRMLTDVYKGICK